VDGADEYLFYKDDGEQVVDEDDDAPAPPTTNAKTSAET